MSLPNLRTLEYPRSCCESDEDDFEGDSQRENLNTSPALFYLYHQALRIPKLRTLTISAMILRINMSKIIIKKIELGSLIGSVILKKK